MYNLCMYVHLYDQFQHLCEGLWIVLFMYMQYMDSQLIYIVLWHCLSLSNL